MGRMATTKLKEAETDLQTQLKRCQYIYDDFRALNKRTGNKLEEMKQAWDKAKQVTITSGALQVSDSGTLEYGWLNPVTPAGIQELENQGNPAERIAGSAASIGATIGAPVVAWTMVGALGTASTGAAISGLSGAAATSATAAWFGGGAVAAGGLGMAAAPFALSGIGLVMGLPIHLAIGAKVAGRSERKTLEKIKEQKRLIITKLYHIKRHESCLNQIYREAAETTTDLISKTADLRTISAFLQEGDPKKEDPEMIASAESLLESMAKAQELTARIQSIKEKTKRDLG